MKIQTILDQVDLGAMALPEFQRGYVWNREQVRRLMNSLYRRYPVGSLLVWVTKTEEADTRGDGTLTPGSVARTRIVEKQIVGQFRHGSLREFLRGFDDLCRVRGLRHGPPCLPICDGTT